MTCVRSFTVLCDTLADQEIVVMSHSRSLHFLIFFFDSASSHHVSFGCCGFNAEKCALRCSAASKEGKKWTARWWETVGGRVGRLSAVSRSRVQVWNWKCGAEPCSSSVFLGVRRCTVYDRTIRKHSFWWQCRCSLVTCQKMTCCFCPLSDWPGIVVPQKTEDELKLRAAVMHP